MKLLVYAKNSKYISRGLKQLGLKRELLAEIKKRSKVKLLEIGCGKGVLLLELYHKFGV